MQAPEALHLKSELHERLQSHRDAASSLVNKGVLRAGEHVVGSSHTHAFLHWSRRVPHLVFEDWVVSTDESYYFACFAVFVTALLFEYLVFLRAHASAWSSINQ